jgi:hypothetical protein
MALTPDGRAIDTRPSDARPPWAANATDHELAVSGIVEPMTEDSATSPSSIKGGSSE